jgi:hypothetical protein
MAHGYSPQQFCFVGAIAALVLGTSAVKAAEYCVTCEGPAAMYACNIEGVADDAPADPRLQLRCVTELAKSGGHESCAVPRSAPKPCPGVMKLVVAPDGVGRPAATTDQSTEQVDDTQVAGPESNSNDVDAGPEQPPKTVEEMAQKTVAASKKGLENAGEAIKGTGDKVGEAGGSVAEAAQKTWNCVTSLFSDC